MNLDRGGPLLLDGRKGTVVTCVLGKLWLTQEGLEEDHVLSPGGRHLLARDGRVHVRALEPSLVRVDEVEAPARALQAVRHGLLRLVEANPGRRAARA